MEVEMWKLLMTAAVLIALTGNAGAMGAMVRATGPYNLTCDEFNKAKPAAGALAVAFAQGYFAAKNRTSMLTTRSTCGSLARAECVHRAQVHG
jgi:HdeA/HdeB family